MGKRANIRATAQNTEQLVAYERRNELIEQGHLPRSASLADAKAKDQELARLHREDNADPKSTAIAGAIITAIPAFIALCALSGAWLIITLLVGAIAVGMYFQAVNDVERREARQGVAS